MRLRDISDRLQTLIDGVSEPLLTENVDHALIQEIGEVHMLYRPIAPAGRKEQSHGWLSFSFEPFLGLIEPFNVHPGRMWAMVRMHRQSSGLPEIAASVTREIPGTNTPVDPDIYVSFSQSPRVETVIKKTGKDPAGLAMYHRGGLPNPQQEILPRELCLPGFEPAMPAGFVDDNIPGVVEMDGEQMLYVGELLFYNNYRTPDRARVRSFVLNTVAVATVARYVRSTVHKSLTEGA